MEEAEEVGGPVAGEPVAGGSDAGARGLHGPERLRVYALARTFVQEVDALVRRSRCGLSLADQITRCAESAMLNIAEGCGHYSPGRKLYHYNIARASAAECLAGLDRLHDLNPRTDVSKARNHAHALGVLLTSLIKTQERRRR